MKITWNYFQHEILANYGKLDLFIIQSERVQRVVSNWQIIKFLLTISRYPVNANKLYFINC